MVSLWNALDTPDTDGMLVLDGDVAIDPHDQEAMMDAISAEPRAVHTAPVKIWPCSTKDEEWVWGHGRTRFTQDDSDKGVDCFTFCYTYLPRRLVVACIKNGMDQWVYPNVDAGVRKQAKQLRLPVRVVWDASVKHLNY